MYYIKKPIPVEAFCFNESIKIIPFQNGLKIVMTKKLELTAIKFEFAF